MIVYVVTSFFHSETEVLGVFASVEAALKSIPDDKEYDKTTIEGSDHFGDGAVVWIDTDSQSSGVEISRFKVVE